MPFLFYLQSEIIRDKTQIARLPNGPGSALERYALCVMRQALLEDVCVTHHPSIHAFRSFFHTFQMISKPSAEHGRSTLRLLARLHRAYISNCPDKLLHTD